MKNFLNISNARHFAVFAAIAYIIIYTGNHDPDSVFCASIAKSSVALQFFALIFGGSFVGSLFELLQSIISRGTHVSTADLIANGAGLITGWVVGWIYPAAWLYITTCVIIGVAAGYIAYIVTLHLGLIKLFRKFAVKHFAWYWHYRWINRSGLRAGAWIFPLTVANGLWIAFSPEVDWWACINWWLFGAWLITLYLGFVYFKIFPAQFRELDDNQKLQMGTVAPDKLTVQEFSEFQELLANQKR